MAAVAVGGKDGADFGFEEIGGLGVEAGGGEEEREKEAEHDLFILR